MPLRKTSRRRQPTPTEALRTRRLGHGGTTKRAAGAALSAHLDRRHARWRCTRFVGAAQGTRAVGLPCTAYCSVFVLTQEVARNIVQNLGDRTARLNESDVMCLSLLLYSSLILPGVTVTFAIHGRDQIHMRTLRRTTPSKMWAPPPTIPLTARFAGADHQPAKLVQIFHFIPSRR